ncbi:conserved hypothetical protein [Ricinus communis]|uniref:Uncharacterized protein n=1 Tax=Ricinus communis TaxID=3988 RepID=B9REA8_RICCO|nr:conserved hypothetical protein [Ricinus communis]
MSGKNESSGIGFILSAVVGVAAVVTGIAGIFSETSGSASTIGRTMKAPGKGYRIPRADFEKDPAAYFRKLRKQSNFSAHYKNINRKEIGLNELNSVKCLASRFKRAISRRWEAKVSDLGLSKIGPAILSISNTHVSTAVKDKTSPECFKTFTEVALKCLADKGTERPTMIDVLCNLEHAWQLEVKCEAERAALNSKTGKGLLMVKPATSAYHDKPDSSWS